MRRKPDPDGVGVAENPDVFQHVGSGPSRESEPMCKHALSELESDGLNLGGVIVKRARWEALEVALAGDRRVNVRNASKETPSVYTVEVEGGVPVSCTCPYDTHNSDPCKHRAHVAMNDLLVSALRAANEQAREVRTDGGETMGPEAAKEREAEAGSSSLSAVERADALGLDHHEDCSDESPADEKLSCWRCYYIDSVGDE